MKVFTQYQDLIALLGRVFVALIFVMAGVMKIFGFESTAEMMAGQGIPMAQLALVLAIILELGGGLMVMFGWKARLGALMLVVFMIPVTFVFHSFWLHEASEIQNQMHHFLKNLTMMGGALYVMAFGAGKYSIDKK